MIWFFSTISHCERNVDLISFRNCWNVQRSSFAQNVEVRRISATVLHSLVVTIHTSIMRKGKEWSCKNISNALTLTASFLKLFCCIRRTISIPSTETKYKVFAKSCHVIFLICRNIINRDLHPNNRTRLWNSSVCGHKCYWKTAHSLHFSYNCRR